MNEQGTTIIKVKSTPEGHYECVPGQERLLAHLAMGKSVMAEDVDTGDRMKLAVRDDGKVMVMPPANAAIAETIAAAAIAKAFRSSSRELQRLNRAAKKKRN